MIIFKIKMVEIIALILNTIMLYIAVLFFLDIPLPVKITFLIISHLVIASIRHFSFPINSLGLYGLSFRSSIAGIARSIDSFNFISIVGGFPENHLLISFTNPTVFYPFRYFRSVPMSRVKFFNNS